MTGLASGLGCSWMAGEVGADRRPRKPLEKDGDGGIVGLDVLSFERFFKLNKPMAESRGVCGRGYRTERGWY
jgi:hypothetical protein